MISLNKIYRTRDKSLSRILCNIARVNLYFLDLEKNDGVEIIIVYFTFDVRRLNFLIFL